MTSRHLVDPELSPVLDVLQRKPLAVEMLAEHRAAMHGVLGPPSEGVEVVERHVEGPDGAPPVRVLLYTPHGVTAPRPAILHIHGGGYVAGAPEMSDASNRQFARELGCVVVSVDYRLAPETPFPGPVEDCYAALKWLASTEALGVDRSRIAVAGESAGGGLAAALALLARDRGEVPVAFQSLSCPMLDDRTPEAEHPFAGEFIWTRERNHFGWNALLGAPPGGPDASPYAVPARAQDLAGLPPAFIWVGALDLLLEENMEYARRLTRAGVPVELHVYPGVYHGHGFAGADTRANRLYLRDRIEGLRHAFAVRPEAAHSP